MVPRSVLLSGLIVFILLAPNASRTPASVNSAPVPTAGTTPTSAHPLAAYTYFPCVMCAVAGDAVFFNASTSYPLSTIKTFTWNFGDGSPNITTTSPEINHLFLNTLPGKWKTTLTVQDGNGQTDTILQEVMFNVLPRFAIIPSHPMIREPVVFNASSTVVYLNSPSAPGYFWNFGDGTTGTGKIVKHAYSATGPYRVLLTVLTSDGNAQISKTLVLFPFINGSQLLDNLQFDDTNITIYGTFTVNQTSRTITGTVTVTATNSTSGEIIYSRSFNIILAYSQNMNPKFLLAIPASPFWLGSTCSIDQSGSANCFVSRNPDATRDGRVDIVDFGMLCYKFGASRGSPDYDPSLDLTNTGTIGIVSTGIMASDYGVPVY